MNKYYKNNLGSFLTEQDQKILLTKTIVVLGCGGNGGYLIDFIARLGVKKIIIFDGDYFEISNINRQNYCFLNTLNCNKAEIAKNFIQNINPQIEIKIFNTFFSEKDISLIQDADIIIDCADNLSEKALFEIKNFIEQKNIAYIFESNTKDGNIISILTKKEEKIFLNEINLLKKYKNIEKKQISQPAFLCAQTASICVAELIKYFTNKEDVCIGYKLKYNFLKGQIFREYY